MNNRKKFIPRTGTLILVSGLLGVLVTWNAGWASPVWDGVWANVGIAVGFIRKVLMVGAGTFLILLVLRAIVAHSRSDSQRQQ